MEVGGEAGRPLLKEDSMILACAFLYRDDPGDVALVDLNKLRRDAPEVAKRIDSQMAAARSATAGDAPGLAARNYYDIELSYAECQSSEMRGAGVDAPQTVDAIVAVFVEQ